MRKVKEVLRLKFEGGQTNRRIARSCRISRPTVADYLLRFEKAGLAWPAAATLDDTTLERKLFPPASTVSTEQRSVPDWHEVHCELRRKGVTLMLLWHEYKLAPSRGLPIQLVLRAVPRLDSAGRRGHASRAPRWGEAVRRLCGTDRRGGGSR